MAICDEGQQLFLKIGHGNRDYKARCGTPPAVAGYRRANPLRAKVSTSSTSLRPSSQAQARQRNLMSREAVAEGGGALCVPPTLRHDAHLAGSAMVADCDGGRKVVARAEDSDSQAFFCKPPFLFHEPPPTPLWKLKASLLVEHSGLKEVRAVTNESLCSNESERLELERAVAGSIEVPVPEIRPMMPVKLHRKDIGAKSRVRLHQEFSTKEAKTHNLRRSGSETAVAAAAAATFAAKEQDEPTPLSDITYYCLKDNAEWRMSRRPLYPSPKPKRPLDGLNGRIRPHIHRTPPERQVDAGPMQAWAN